MTVSYSCTICESSLGTDPGYNLLLAFQHQDIDKSLNVHNSTIRVPGICDECRSNIRGIIEDQIKFLKENRDIRSINW